jgi:putative transposon-encoded protein
MEIKTTAYEATDRTCRKCGTGAHVTLPKRWRDKRVKILLIEPLEEVKTG